MLPSKPVCAIQDNSHQSSDSNLQFYKIQILFLPSHKPRLKCSAVTAVGAAFPAHSKTEHSQPSRKDGAVLSTCRGVRKGRNQGGILDFGFEYQRTVIPSTELRGAGRKAGLRLSFRTSQVSDDEYIAKQMGGLPLGGRGGVLVGSLSAALSVQTE